MEKRPATNLKKPSGPNPWPSAELAVAMILFGERYANDRLHFISRIITCLSVALIISLIGNLAMLPNPARYRYVPVSTSGLVLPQIPLNQANHDDKFVTDWTIDAITRLYSFDFMNYRDQLQTAQKNLTAMGWDSFQESMQETNYFSSILGNRFVLTAVPTGEGIVASTGMIGGNYSWTVKFPMLVSYRASATIVDGVKAEGRVISETFNMTILVTRVGVFLNHSGLGIKAIVATR